MKREKIKHREKYEWVRIWWDNANDSSGPRILLIGDSITAGYRPFVKEMLDDITLVDQLATSRSIADPALMKELKYVLSEYNYEVIHFNNGLHGWHVDEETYRESLEAAILEILESQKTCRLIIATTTPSTIKGKPDELNSDRDVVITGRNRIVKEISLKHGLLINDLYAHIIGDSGIRHDDGSHYNEHGWKILAEKVVSAINSVFF